MSALSRFKRFLRARDGVAAVEFALIMPIMLMVYIGGVEVSQGLAADRKLDALVNTVGDLVARHTGDVERARVVDYFEAARPLMLPFDADEVLQRITVVEVDSGGVARVRDSAASNGATTPADDSVVTLPAEIAALASGNWLVIAEAWYDYTPALGFVVGSDIALAKRQYFVPRDPGGLNIVD